MGEWGSEFFSRYSNYNHLIFGGGGEGEKSQTICYFTVTYLLINRFNEKNSRKIITAF